MPTPVFLPFTTKSTQKCPRCELRYAKGEAKCSHCAELSDAEVMALRARTEAENQGNAAVGKIFLLVFALLAVLFLIFLLS